MNLKYYIDLAGGAYKVADRLGLTHKSVYKWIDKDCLPHTEYSGTTKYAETIEIMTNGLVKKDDLLLAGRPKLAG